jgi:hypothetical protein
MMQGPPFDVEGVDLGLTAEEIVTAIREGRERQTGGHFSS